MDGGPAGGAAIDARHKVAVEDVVGTAEDGGPTGNAAIGVTVVDVAILPRMEDRG